ncbi:hypothetical protein KJY73_14175 [Bowmanella sp. Y26]|uniref:leucine-rich repeat domain-containing protein n=1 Tax=Bowmanella yangjiangensis TaxID=2811230 RepID=UPI001BDC8148|nr:hypothetical protein [Bowmanella yangjiangensis]MBT1064735.1 hypothetical protein [Bowmanella yangjiangensis]
MNRLLSSGLLCLFVSACGGGGSSEPAPTKPANKAPVVSPMESVSAYERDDVTVTATATDSDGQVSQYQWVQTAGLSATISKSDGAELSFIAPELESDETLEFQLTVTDNQGATASQKVSVNVSAYDAIDSSLFSNADLLYCLNAINADIGIKELSCELFSSNNLDGLESLTKLRNLSLKANEFGEVSALEELAELRFLKLEVPYNQHLYVPIIPTLEHLLLHNISVSNLNDTLPLAENLVTLRLTGNNYYSTSVDFSTIENLSKLRDIELVGTRSTNHESLAKLIELERLVLSQTGLRTLSFVPKLTSLVELDISNNSLYDFTALENSTSLTSLNLYGLDIGEAAWLGSMSSLKTLKIGGIQRLDSSALAGLKELEWLELTGVNELTKLDSLTGLKKLTHLDLHSNRLSSVAFIRELNELISLNLYGNERVSDVSHLEKLTKLEELNLGYLRYLTELSPISDLTSLKRLNLSGVADYGGNIDETVLSSLTKLEFLDISTSRITKLDFLSSLVNLQHLIANTYYDRSLPDLSELTALHTVEFGRISDSNIQGLSGNLAIQNFKVREFLGPDLSNLTSLTSLKKLDVEYANIVESGVGVENLVNLKFFRIANVSFGDFPSLSSLNELEYFELGGARVETLEFLDGTTSLKRVVARDLTHLTCDSIAKFEEDRPLVLLNKPYDCVEVPVDDLVFTDTKLQECIRNRDIDAMDIHSLTCTGVSTLQGLSQLTNLTEIQLSDVTNATNLNGLADVEKLTRVALSATDEQNLTSLGTMPALTGVTSFSVYNSGLTNLLSLPNMSKLERLSINSGDLNSLAGIGRFPLLSQLDAEYTKLTDVSDAFSHSNLKYMYLYGVSTLTCADLEALRQSIQYVSHYGNCVE